MEKNMQLLDEKNNLKVGDDTTFTSRRYDVDWLRNLALLLLILYHVGMYYVADWGWHIKSPNQSVLLQNFMVMSNLWRMCLLFFISGITLALIDKKYSASGLLKTRFMRLFIPLLFGMAIIVPPQLYYELIANNQYNGSYGAFWLQYINLNTSLLPEKQSVIGLYTWNHLWYLVYLFVYTGVFLLIRPLLRRVVNSEFYQAINGFGLIAIFATCLLVAWVYVRPVFPTTHGLTDDWWSHVKYFMVLVMGYAFAHRIDIWQWVISHAGKLFIGGLCTYAFVALDRNGAFPFMADAFKNHLTVQFMYGGVIIANLWFWMLSLVGFAGRYLNKPSALLRYANKAVLPWYILHQTVIVVIAANLAIYAINPLLESALIIALCVFICVISFEVIKRFTALRFLFGITGVNNEANNNVLKKQTLLSPH
jgi:hypothetical protein